MPSFGGSWDAAALTSRGLYRHKRVRRFGLARYVRQAGRSASLVIMPTNDDEEVEANLQKKERYGLEEKQR